MDGAVSEQATKTREFGKKLQNLLPKDMKYIEWDERLTTFEAKNAVVEAAQQFDYGMQQLQEQMQQQQEMPYGIRT